MTADDDDGGGAEEVFCKAVFAFEAVLPFRPVLVPVLAVLVLVLVLLFEVDLLEL